MTQPDKHPAPAGHPESAERIDPALEEVLASDAADNLELVTPGETDIAAIGRIHDAGYLDRARDLAESGGGYLDGDTYMAAGSYTAAIETASAAIYAVDQIMAGRLKRLFLAGRPPGHHAEHDHGMGFCIINNVAVAAETLTARYGLDRVAIVDWDVHHGNGTQNTFFERSDVLYISLHHFPFYPGSGAAGERGRGAGDGYTLNIPLFGGSGSEAYRRVFDDLVVPKLVDYRPEFILISCGFDPHREDPLGGMNLTEDDFGVMTGKLVSIADEFSSGRILSVFEGGYNAAANARCLACHLRELRWE